MDRLDASYETAMDPGKLQSARLKAVDHLCNVAKRSPNEENQEKAIEYLQRLADNIFIDPAVKERAQDCL